MLVNCCRFNTKEALLKKAAYVIDFCFYMEAFPWVSTITARQFIIYDPSLIHDTKFLLMCSRKLLQLTLKKQWILPHYVFRNTSPCLNDFSSKLDFEIFDKNLLTVVTRSYTYGGFRSWINRVNERLELDWLWLFCCRYLSEIPSNRDWSQQDFPPVFSKSFPETSSLHYPAADFYRCSTFNR